jgi:hypothetical protein
VFEFRIYATGEPNDPNPPASDQGVGRYKQLYERAATLQAAGWTAWPPATGLAFRPPDACLDAGEARRRPRAVQALLRRMHAIEQRDGGLPDGLSELQRDAGRVFPGFLHWIRGLKDVPTWEWKPSPWWDSEDAAGDEAGAEPAPTRGE